MLLDTNRLRGKTMSDTTQHLSKEAVYGPGATPESQILLYAEGAPIRPDDTDELVRQGYMTKKDATKADK